MSQERIAPDLRTVKLSHNRISINEVYDEIRKWTDAPAKEFTRELIEFFIEESADAAEWYKTLCNLEYNRRQPRSRKVKRSYRSNKGNQKHNPAEALAKATAFNALMEAS